MKTSTSAQDIANKLRLPSTSLPALQHLTSDELSQLKQFLTEGFQHQQKAHLDALPKWLKFFKKQ